MSALARSRQLPLLPVQFSLEFSQSQILEMVVFEVCWCEAVVGACDILRDAEEGCCSIM